MCASLNRHKHVLNIQFVNLFRVDRKAKEFLNYSINLNCCKVEFHFDTLMHFCSWLHCKNFIRSKYNVHVLYCPFSTYMCRRTKRKMRKNSILQIKKPHISLREIACELKLYATHSLHKWSFLFLSFSSRYSRSIAKLTREPVFSLFLSTSFTLLHLN